ncbi:MAG TPA: NERD domain-containing protein [Candidatus Aphodousia gallistercoris]|nr:NERD domain-containing protein [Candidatus Aphodousia gallistercoris]
MSASALFSIGDLTEQKVYEKLKELPSGFEVLRNVTISAHGGDSELDILVVTPKAVVVLLEVKAGDLSADEQGSVLRRYQGQAKDIAAQLVRQKAILRNRLQELAGRCRVVSFLVLPTGTFEGTSVGVERDKIIDATDFDQLCERIIDSDREAAIDETTVDRQNLLAFLDSAFVVRQSISSLSDTLDVRCRELSAGLATWVPRISSPLPVIEVQAPAGAGKTQLALSLLQKAARQNKSAWYINSTSLVVHRLRKLPINQKVRFIGTWYELAIEETRATDPSEIEGGPNGDYFERVSEAFAQKLTEGHYAIDCIILDDAQEFKPEYVQALGCALSAEGVLYVLSDPNLYGKGLEFAESVQVASNESARIPGNVAEVINALRLTREPVISTSPYPGSIPDFLEYRSEGSLLKATRKAVDMARSEGFADDQIAILSFKSLGRSALRLSPSLGTSSYRLKMPTDTYQKGERVWTQGSLFLDTIRRFKGMQAPCVILSEVQFESLGEAEKSLLYLGMSRASMNLKIVIHEDSAAILQRALQ